ncbi:MAG: TIGR00730 family Rossman fold protein [Paludibacteraceae bacterium]|nr:TIGR00730 family Rossman fold protein [Paludibacteraceae bacterium]
MIKRVCVYCASSSKVAEEYKNQAFRLGQLLAEAKIETKFGSGSVGLMGELSKGVLSKNGTIIGVIPQFMVDEGWGNAFVTKQIVTNSMHERKKTMVEDIDAAIALPGGCGTMEELLEIITWKQLGLFDKPIIILNVNHYYDDLLHMMDKIVAENFMRNEHLKMWTVVENAEQILPTIESMPAWSQNARTFAAI